MRPAGSSAPLKSLAGCALAERFHAWRGLSGQRYVCSVFALRAADPDAGLPEFSGVVVLAVKRYPDGGRCLAGLGQFEPAANPYRRECFILEALAAGACEWHVHLRAGEAVKRRAILADIEAMQHGRRASVA